MCIVISDNSSNMIIMQGKRIFDAMWDVDIFRSSVNFKFYPKSIIHWKHLAI